MIEHSRFVFALTRRSVEPRLPALVFFFLYRSPPKSSEILPTPLRTRSPRRVDVACSMVTIYTRGLGILFHLKHNHVSVWMPPDIFLMKMFRISHVFQSYRIYRYIYISLCKKCLFSTSPPRLTVCSSPMIYVRRVLCMSQSTYVHL